MLPDMSSGQDLGYLRKAGGGSYIHAYCSWPGGNWSALAEPLTTASGDITIGRSEVWDLWPGVAYVSSWAAWLSMFSASEVACKSVEAIVSSILAEDIALSWQ